MTSFLALWASVCVSVECLIPRFYRLGWNSYLGSILRLGWNNYLDGTTTWVRTCVLRPLGHSLYQLSYVEHLLGVRAIGNRGKNRRSFPPWV